MVKSGQSIAIEQDGRETQRPQSSIPSTALTSDTPSLVHVVDCRAIRTQGIQDVLSNPDIYNGTGIEIKLLIRLLATYDGTMTATYEELGNAIGTNKRNAKLWIRKLKKAGKVDVMALEHKQFQVRLSEPYLPIAVPADQIPETRTESIPTDYQSLSETVSSQGKILIRVESLLSDLTQAGSSLKTASLPDDSWTDSKGMAEHLHLSLKAVREGAKRGDIPSHRYPQDSIRGRLLFKKSEVDRVLTRKPKEYKRKGLSPW